MRVHTPPSIAKIESALVRVDSSDRDTWFKVGMALKAELGEDGFPLWDEWSQTGDGYDKHDTKIAWKSFKQSGSINIGKLFKYALKNGWSYDDRNERRPTQQEVAEANERRRVANETTARV